MNSDLAYAFGLKKNWSFTFHQHSLPFRIGVDCENEGVMATSDYTVSNDDGTVKFQVNVGDRLLSCKLTDGTEIPLQWKSFVKVVHVLDETARPLVVTFEHRSTEWFYNHVLSLESSIILTFGAVGNRMTMSEYLELKHKDRLFLVNKVKDIFKEAMQLAYQKAQQQSSNGVYEL